MAESNSVSNFSSFVCYTGTPTTFIKRDLLDGERKHRSDGSIISRPWAAERLRNEATALQLVAKHTTIPVPKVISFGKYENGSAYLEVERLSGIVLEKIKSQCRMEEGGRHVREGLCNDCGSIAEENAKQFINEIVLPQLAKLRSQTTGLDGFVLPPPWILEYDNRHYWEPKTAASASYTFCHGDLAAHNIMMDPRSLRVVGIFDWEHAGYFPPEFLVWFVNRQRYWDYFRDTKRIEKHPAYDIGQLERILKNVPNFAAQGMQADSSE